MKTKTYDQKCLDIAQNFLSDHQMTVDRRAQLEHELAQDIQQAIEDFMEDNNLQ